MAYDLFELQLGPDLVLKIDYLLGELIFEAGDLFESEGRLLLSCREGVLELLEVQPAGGRPMEAAAYLRGYGLPERR